MVKERFENKPDPILPLGSGKFIIHYDIEEIDDTVIEDGEPATEVTAYLAHTERVELLDYGHIVCKLIRKRYSESEEFAIHRQRDEKPADWLEYYLYCEECKSIAREVLKIDEDES